MKKTAFTIVQLFITLAVVGLLASVVSNFMNQVASNGKTNGQIAASKIESVSSQVAPKNNSGVEFAGVLGKFSKAQK